VMAPSHALGHSYAHRANERPYSQRVKPLRKRDRPVYKAEDER